MKGLIKNMLIYKSNKNYSVYLEEDGDDLWVSVRNELGEREDFIVGSIDDEKLPVSNYVYNAFSSFYPFTYVAEHSDILSERQDILYYAITAFEIDRALEEAYDKTIEGA